MARDLSYRFNAPAHWAAGARSGLSDRNGVLVFEPPLVARRVAPFEAGTIAAVDACGRLTWLRASGEIVVLQDSGPVPQAWIAVSQASAFYPGGALLWVRAGQRLGRFAARSFQELGWLDVPDLIATAPDGCDGLWLLGGGDGDPNIRWLDRHGHFRQRPIRLHDAVRPVAIAADHPRRRLAVLDVDPPEHGAARAWRIHIVDLEECRAHHPYRFTPRAGDPLPSWIAADGEGGFRLVSSQVPPHLYGVSADGIETSRQELAHPKDTVVVGLFGPGASVLACEDGIYRLVPAEARDEAVDWPEAKFITPTLMSPPGTPSGWNRAEIDVDLPTGATLDATVFASESAALARDVRKAIAETWRNPARRMAELERLLSAEPARTLHTRSYEGTGRQVLHLLLDGIPDPYVWLKLELRSPPGAAAARLTSLRVRYPDRSWLDDLPAIYREHPGPAAQLRQFLAPFEALFGGIDEAIDRLPARIHPDTAEDGRLGWLLGWLGFPPTAGLGTDAQRKLLKAAGGLLERRGTGEALRETLEIVTGNDVVVEDGGGLPGFWVLAQSPVRLAPRLGCGTRVISSLPLGFRPGAGLRLGMERLPPFCTDLDRVIAAHCARVTIRISLERGRDEILRPIVESLLAMFVPAHCAVDLRVVRAGRTPESGRLDRGWRLAGDRDREGGERLADAGLVELGAETEAGGWRLPSLDRPGFAIDGNAALDGAGRLA